MREREGAAQDSRISGGLPFLAPRVTRSADLTCGRLSLCLILYEFTFHQGCVTRTRDGRVAPPRDLVPLSLDTRGTGHSL